MVKLANINNCWYLLGSIVPDELGLKFASLNIYCINSSRLRKLCVFAMIVSGISALLFYEIPFDLYNCCTFGCFTVCSNIYKI